MRLTRLVTIAILLCPAFLAAPRDRITRPVDSRDLVTVKGHVHPALVSAADLGAVDGSFAVNDILLLIKPSGQQQADLDQLLADQQNPSSPHFHQWLTPEAFGDRFGLGAGDHSKLVTWLESQKLSVRETGRGRNWVAFSGTADQVTRAFHMPIHRFEVKGRTHFANTVDPSVPAALADVVGGFIGLSDFTPESNLKAVQPDYNSGSSHYLGPDDFATIYDLKPLYAAGFDGTGQSIAIVGQAALPLTDVRLFRTRFGLSANDPSVVLFGTDPGGLSAETNLDVEWAGAVAPKATIYYVYTSNAFTALVDAISLNAAPVISNSYGTCENNVSPPGYRAVMQQANAQGITILSASGDGGAAGCYDQSTLYATHGERVIFPASLPEVTGVGGTQFVEGSGTYWAASNTPTTLGSALSYIPEAVWNESVAGSFIAGSSGGPSAVYSKPSWQQAPGVPNDNARDVPDIALSAAGHDPYVIYYSGGAVSVYGTSAAAPSAAGIFAILNQYVVSKGYQKTAGLGNVNPQLYRLAQTAPSAFHDITSGDNIVPCTQGSPNCLTGTYGFKAGVGYDLATGLGSLDANNLVTQWNAATNGVTVSVVVGSARVTVRDTILLTAVVSPVKGATLPTGVVDFSVGSVGLGESTITVRAGSAVADFSLPAYLLGSSGTYTINAQYSGDSSFNGGSGTVRITVTLPTGISAIVPSASVSPVFPGTDGRDLIWLETLRLHEVAGVASMITGVTLDGQAQKLSDYFPAPAIPPNATIASSVVALRNLAYPVTKVFGVTGVDATGQTWSVQVPVLFLGPSTSSAGINTTVIPLTMAQSPNADPSCQWSQQVFLDESAGYTTSIASLYEGGLSITAQASALFGTSRLMAWQSLSGTLCWSGVTPGNDNGVSVGLANGLTQQVNVNFTGPVSNPIGITASPTAVTLNAATTKTAATASLSVTLSDKSQPWVASVFPGSAAGSWLSVSPLSGTGTGTLTISASGANFEPGVYKGTIVIYSANAVPATVNIPVMFVNGGSSAGIAIQKVANGASFGPLVSPGSVMSIFGLQLANSTKSAATTPLPVSLDGVSVRVNGVDAPLVYISPTQLNVQLPYEVGAGPAVVGVNNNGQIGAFLMTVAPTAPGIFADAKQNLVPAAPVAPGGTAVLYFTGDGDINTTLATGSTPSSTTSSASLPKSRLPFSITVGGVPAFVQFYGIASGLVGVSQVNFTVPASVAPGVQPVVVTVGGVSSPAVNLTVQAVGATQ